MPTAAWVLAVALSLQNQAIVPPAQSVRWTDDRPLTQLAHNLRRDLTHVRGMDTASLIVFGAIGGAVARPSDHRLARWAHEAGESRSYTPIGSVLGNEWLQGGAAIASYAIGTVQHSPELAHIGSDLIRAQVLNGVFTTSLKLAASRTRPNGGGRSFPSGHSSATFASVTVLSDHYGWKVGVPGYALAGFIGWTRVRDREHWLSDVIVGSTMGVIAGRAISRAHGASSWTVAPVALRGGGAIYVVKQ